MHALSFADSTVKHTLFYFIFVFNKFDKYFTFFFKMFPEVIQLTFELL